MLRGRAGDPVLLPLPFPVPLAGPGEGGREREPRDGVEAVTGGGLVALVDPTRGLRGIWKGREHAAGRLLLRWKDHPLHPASGIRMDGGGWRRRIPLPEGGSLVETAVLPESAPAVLLHWRIEAAPSPDAQPDPEGLPLLLELLPPAGRDAVRVPLDPLGPSGAGVAIVGPGTELAGLVPRLRPPHARELARRTARRHEAPLAIASPRGGSPGLPRAEVRPGGGDPADRIRAAVEILARSPLAFAAGGGVLGPFLLGVHDGAPLFAEGAPLVEIGLGSLLAGNPEAGWAVLDEALSGDVHAPVAVARLATSLAAWTGDMRRLGERRPQLDRVAALVAEGGRGGGAAFASPARTLEDLASAVERAGGGWADGLRERAAGLRSPRRRAGGRPLPVLGSPGMDPAAEAEEAHEPLLPPPSAFSSANDPGTAPTRSLHAARLVRSWVEAALAAEADAAYGRLRLGPDLRESPEGLEVEGLLVGDARVSLCCRADAGGYKFRLRQEGGRSPLNLVFRPRLPIAPPLRVTVGEEAAQVEVEASVGGGAMVSLQFPLDPERTIAIDSRS